jgi:hypothetical protein
MVDTFVKNKALRSAYKKKKLDRIYRIKNRIYRISCSKILNPVNPEKSC